MEIMNKICTSIEQSKKLIELGIDVYTADMYWWICHGFQLSAKPYTEEVKKGFEKHHLECIPAWSLVSLVKLTLYGNLAFGDKGFWMVYNGKKRIASKTYDEPINAAFETVSWLLENKKI